jgi:hypothetical protein
MEKYYQRKWNITLLLDYGCQLKITLQIHTRRTEAERESEHIKCKFTSSIATM